MPSKRHNRAPSLTVPGTPTISYPPLVAGLGLMLLSAAGLAFEVILTHLYSLIFQYHFAFLAVSTAILGLGVGALLGFRMRLPSAQEMPAWSVQGAALLAVVIPAGVILFNLTGFVPGYILQILLGAGPFVLVGLITARLYEFFDRRAAWLYAFDLAGAALGLVGVLGLLDRMSAPSAAFVLALLAGLAALVFSLGKRAGLWVPLGALGLAAVCLAVNLLFHVVDLPRVSAGSLPPDKTMFQLLADPTAQNKLVDSAWSSFARVDLVAGSDASQMFVFTNAGAGSYMIRFNGDLAQVDWLKNQVEYLPFLNFSPQKTLILGAGAGKDVLQALLAGSRDITAVEINPAMLAITRKHADFNGEIFDYPGVTTLAADGRNYLERSSSSYDMIYLNLVYAQAPAPGSNALSEAYIFTSTAFQQYWRHLAPHGRLAIVTHQGLEGARSAITAIRTLNLEGINAQAALKHIALLMYNASDPNQATSVMILQKAAFTTGEVTSLKQAGKTAGMMPLFLTGTDEALFADLVSGKSNLDQFMTQKDFNLFPTTDESPFFFNFNPGLPQPLRILLGISGAALVLYLLFLLGTRNRPNAGQLAFFGGLGMGYILIEVPLIQRTILLVGSPTLAMVVVLVALMLSGGLASFLSSRWSTEKLWKRLALAGVLIALLAAGLAYLQPPLLRFLETLPSASRILLGGLSLAPLGLLMGLPFANGLRLGGLQNKRTLPYLWGWNAVTAAAGSSLAACVAIWAGFGTGLLLGAACYLVAAAAAILQSR
jgi:predicted membrane-bound spermidine synthase